MNTYAMIITGKDELIKYILEKAPKAFKMGRKGFYRQETLINRKTFRGITLTKEFSGIEFKNCKFIDCKFENVWGFFFILENCQFKKCEFRNSRFSHLDYCWDNIDFEQCFFRNVQFDEGALFNIFFSNCQLYSTNILGFVPLSNVCFINCNIENGQFQSLVYYHDENEIDIELPDLIFNECSIEFSTFNSVNFINSCLVDVVLYKSSFIDCRIGENTFLITKENKFPNYASIDFQTIIKSEKIDKKILEIYFNIYDLDLKNTITQITSRIEFNTVFISYCFEDKVLAKQINQFLNQHGVKTFIWEKDAPGGKRLDDIMSINIKKHDKILFIASQFSIKSKACQFEISQGRKKQEETWDSVFFPIHIDDFLFKVQPNQIRPIEKKDEYWENIEEIKRINSIDFSRFNKSKPDLDDLKLAVEEIIKELKLLNGSAQYAIANNSGV